MSKTQSSWFRGFCLGAGAAGVFACATASIPKNAPKPDPRLQELSSLAQEATKAASFLKLEGCQLVKINAVYLEGICTFVATENGQGEKPIQKGDRVMLVSVYRRVMIGGPTGWVPLGITELPDPFGSL